MFNKKTITTDNSVLISSADCTNRDSETRQRRSIAMRTQSTLS